jgi:hypothetical protein
MDGLLAQAPGMPQMLADLGPITDAAVSVDRRVVVVRREKWPDCKLVPWYHNVPGNSKVL